MNTVSSPHSRVGTPADYSTDPYLVHFELAQTDGEVESILQGYSHRPLVRLLHGYQTVMYLQSVPEAVRDLCRRNIAVYQVLRLVRLDSKDKTDGLKPGT